MCVGGGWSRTGGIRWPWMVTLEPFRSKRRALERREPELPGGTPTTGRASAAGTQRKESPAGKAGSGWVLEPGEATWGMSVGRDQGPPGDGGRK